MPSPITKKTLEYLAGLARLKLDGRSEGKLLADLERILGYFVELKEVPTEGVVPMTGGTKLHDATRGDGELLDDDLGKGVAELPSKDKKDGFLKIPNVF